MATFTPQSHPAYFTLEAVTNPGEGTVRHVYVVNLGAIAGLAVNDQISANIVTPEWATACFLFKQTSTSLADIMSINSMVGALTACLLVKSSGTASAPVCYTAPAGNTGGVLGQPAGKITNFSFIINPTTVPTGCIQFGFSRF